MKITITDKVFDMNLGEWSDNYATATAFAAHLESEYSRIAFAILARLGIEAELHVDVTAVRNTSGLNSFVVTAPDAQLEGDLLRELGWERQHLWEQWSESPEAEKFAKN